MTAADLGRPDGVFNAAVLTQPPGAGGWGATLDAVEDFYADGAGRVHLWSPWPTPNLRGRGWALDGHPRSSCDRRASPCRPRPPVWTSAT